jgi:serine/threonine protein kinase
MTTFKDHFGRIFKVEEECFPYKLTSIIGGKLEEGCGADGCVFNIQDHKNKVCKVSPLNLELRGGQRQKFTTFINIYKKASMNGIGPKIYGSGICKATKIKGMKFPYNAYDWVDEKRIIIVNNENDELKSLPPFYGFIVMEKLQGVELHEYTNPKHRSLWGNTALITKYIIQKLKSLNKMGIQHGDFNSSNIFLKFKNNKIQDIIIIDYDASVFVSKNDKEAFNLDIEILLDSIFDSYLGDYLKGYDEQLDESIKEFVLSGGGMQMYHDFKNSMKTNKSCLFM